MLDETRLDTLSYSLARYREVTPRMAFRAADIPAWKAQARARLRELLGPMPGERDPLNVAYGEAEERGGFDQIPVTFATRPGLDAFGFLLIPQPRKPGQPAVICLPG